MEKLDIHSKQEIVDLSIPSLDDLFQKIFIPFSKKQEYHHYLVSILIELARALSTISKSSIPLVLHELIYTIMMELKQFQYLIILL